MEEILKVQGLKKTFKLSAKQQKIEKTKEKVKVAVNDLSFTAYRGEVFGLLGPNGAGKTTTLRMLATLIRPDGGDAVLDGASIVKEPEEVRGKIGFLTSELKLEDFFTPNYLFDFFADLHGMDAESRKQRKELLFKRFGIDEFAEVQLHQWDHYQPANRERIWGIFGENDHLAHYEPLFLKYYPHAWHFPGAHTPTAEEVQKYYIPLIEKLLTL